MPVSLNGDLKNQFVETTVGFDTVCKVKKKHILVEILHNMSTLKGLMWYTLRVSVCSQYHFV